MNLSPQNICKDCMHRNHQNKSSIASFTKGKNIYWLSKKKRKREERKCKAKVELGRFVVL
jgi:hypothetical protein